MGNYLKTSLAVLLLALCMLMPAHAEQYINLTEHFAEETRWLADNVTRETRSENMFRTRGMVHFADSKPLEVGDVEQFSTFNLVRNAHEKIRAVLRKIGENCYIYVEEGQTIDNRIITRIANEFDKKIYPETRSWFGSEWKPGIDEDPRIALLLYDVRDGYNPSQGRRGYTAGYFYAGDNYLRSKNPNSNERSILYLDIDPTEPGSDKFMSTLAHEFQHMIHWNNDPKEFVWVNESMSQLSQFICGYGHPDQVHMYIRSPDNNLVAWSNDNMIANYGQVYMWAYYLSTKVASTADRRRAFIRRIVAQSSQGLSGINAAIKKQGIKTNVRTLFRNFSVANYLNDDRIERGVYGYDKNLSRFYLRPEITFNGPPFEGKGSVKTWSAKAVEINPTQLRGRKARLTFSGQKIHSGKYSNGFDVALVTFAKNRTTTPTVKWLSIRDHKATLEFEMPNNHDQLMLVVVNRGPEVMKVEQVFARKSPPAAFSFAIRPLSASISRSVASAPSRSIPGYGETVSMSVASSMLEYIVSGPDLEQMSGMLLSISEDSKKTAAEVELDFAFQKVTGYEDRIVHSIRNSIRTNKHELVDLFCQIYDQSSAESKSRLEPLKIRISDILKFEQLQGNIKAGELLNYLLSE